MKFLMKHGGAAGGSEVPEWKSEREGNRTEVLTEGGGIKVR